MDPSEIENLQNLKTADLVLLSTFLGINGELIEPLMLTYPEDGRRLRLRPVAPLNMHV